MKIQDIIALGPEKALQVLTKAVRDTDIEKWRDEYAGTHAILNKMDKKIGETKTVILNKLVTTFQKTIVEGAISFLFGVPPAVTLASDDTTQTAFDRLRLVFKKCKAEALNRKLARALFVDTQAAELWYAVKATPEATAKIGVILLRGDQIWAHFDETGDMDAFVRRYNRDIGDGFTPRNEQVAEIYTADTVIVMTNSGNGWQTDQRPNLFGKIPVVYYEQDKPEWSDVQTLIDRMEEVLSSHADTNDYFASPIIKAFGKIKSLPEKQQTGKMIQFEAETGIDGKPTYGDATYLTWDQSPESLKLEIDNLKGLIYALTNTPDVSFDNVKGIGNISGIALKLMFLSAIHKAMNKQEIFGAAIERRVSVVKSIIAVTDVALAGALENLEVDIHFSDCLPANDSELITTLSAARGGGPVMSMETAVKNNPFVVDAEAEITAMDAEVERASVNSIAGSFVP